MLYSVKKLFLVKLSQLIKSEQRKSVVVKSSDPLKQFRSVGTDVIPKDTIGDDDSVKDDGEVVGVPVKDIDDNEPGNDEDDDDDIDDDDTVEEDDYRSVSEVDGTGDTDVNELAADLSTNKEFSGKESLKKSSKVDEESLIFNEKLGVVEFVVSLPANSRRLLMAQVVESAASSTMVRFTKDISNAYVINENSSTNIQTDGVNFEAIWALSSDSVDMNGIMSNDIYCILMTYGVEAARLSIVREITSVFGVYGINVNPRHLSLIADFMTRNGSYLAMNRIGMNDCSSPFLQMSFETTCNFLTKAAFEGLSDNQESPSSRIVLGSVAKVGTGCFDLMLPLSV